VSLVLGKGMHKKTLKEQTAFLAEISEYFEALFYNEFAEHDKNIVTIEVQVLNT
jgi:BTB/POZ domain